MSDAGDMDEVRRRRFESLERASRAAIDQLEAALEAGDEEQLLWAMREAGDATAEGVVEWVKLGQWLDEQGAEREELRQALARSLKAWRQETGRTQEGLATDMQRLGFVTWARITVAEAESGKRRLSLEEALGLAVLFGLSLDRLIGPTAGRIVLNERRSMSRQELRALIGGTCAEAAEDAADAAAQIARVTHPGAEDDWRPIADIERGRR